MYVSASGTMIAFITDMTPVSTRVKSCFYRGCFEYIFDWEKLIYLYIVEA